MFERRELALGADRSVPALHQSAIDRAICLPPTTTAPVTVSHVCLLPMQFFDDFSTKNSDFAVALSEYDVKDINK